MLKWLQIDSIHFLIAKQMIAHNYYSALICQFPILSKRLNPTLKQSVCHNCKICLCIILLLYNPPLFADVQLTGRNCCSPVTTYLQDSENDNYYTKFNIDYDVASLLHATTQAELTKLIFCIPD